MATSMELYETEDVVKQNLLDLVTNLSHVELKIFSQDEYKKKAFKELCKLLPTYEKSKLSETAQCISNALQSEVRVQLRKRSRECTKSGANVLSETIISDLDSTLQLESDTEGAHAANEQSYSQSYSQLNDVNMSDPNDSITHLKQIASESSEKIGSSTISNACNITEEMNITGTIKCMECNRDKCLGTDESRGLWLCHDCKEFSRIMKDDVITLKNDIKQLKEHTDTILTAVNSLTSELETCISGLHDKITALSNQIKTRDNALSGSIETLTLSIQHSNKGRIK